MNRLILVNKQNPISKDYFNDLKLIGVLNVNNDKTFVEEETYYHYIELKKFLQSKGIEIGISSAFRSILKQTKIKLESYILYGKDYVKTFVSNPYYSEHHTGLAIDINIKVDGRYPYSIEEIYKNIELYESITKYLHNFGFIVRYPLKKEHITGFQYEPWHIRYVGEYAKDIYESNLTLEEYVLNLEKNKGAKSMSLT